jgi:hypothetical protein
MEKTRLCLFESKEHLWLMEISRQGFIEKIAIEVMLEG